MAVLTAGRPLALKGVISSQKSTSGAVAWAVEAIEGISVTEASNPVADVDDEKAIAERRAAETEAQLTERFERDALPMLDQLYGTPPTPRIWFRRRS